MLILRIAAIAIVLWVAMVVVRRIKIALEAKKSEIAHQGKMVKCDVCGVYLPDDEAVAEGDGKFRCERH